MRWRLLSNSEELLVPISTSSQVHSAREHLYLELEHDGLFGYGEITPQPVELNGDAGVTDVLAEWTNRLCDTFREVVVREGGAPPWFRVARFSGSRSSAAFAGTLLEMAVLDLELKQTQKSLGELWEPKFKTPFQVTMSGSDSSRWLSSPGAKRLRIKVGRHGLDAETISLVQALPVPILLDFNCGAHSLHQVIELVDTLGDVVDVVEQPFAPGNLVDHALLAREVSCRVSLDEGVRTLNDVRLIARHDAASLLCIKPARVGGYANARALALTAKDLGLQTYVGGFFESPLARHTNKILAASITPEASDISPVITRSTTSTDWVGEKYGLGLAPTQEFLSRCREVAHSTISV